MSSRSVTIRELISSSIELSWREALALAQSIAATESRRTGDAESGRRRPPDGDMVDEFALDDAGAISAAADGTAVSSIDLATFLVRLLPDDTGPVAQHVPAGLRFALARALARVEAAPFASLEEFSQALGRFEQADRSQLLRVVFKRYSAVHHGPAANTAQDRATRQRRVERRSSGAGTDVLRRMLREADREIFLSRHASGIASPSEVRRHGPGPDMLRRLLRDEDQRNYEQRSVPRARTGVRIVLWGRHRAVAALVVLLVAAAAMAERQPIRNALHSLARSHASRSLDEGVSGAGVHVPGAIGTRGLTASHKPELVPQPAAIVNRSRALRPRPDTAEGDAVTASLGSSLDPLPALQGNGRLVQALDVAQRPVFSPSFEGYRSALFEAAPQGGAAAAGAGANEYVRVLSIADDRGRNYHPALSPDGRTIAFDSDRDGVRGVYLATRDGRDVRRVSGPEYAAFAAWSPDGNHLAFIRSEPGQANVWNVWSLNVQSGGMARLTAYHSGQPWGVSWFPDSRRICYAHEGEIAVLDTMTSETYVWSSPRADGMARMPIVSPDGKRVLFQVHNDGAWLLELADGSMREVLADPTAQDFAWSPDGRSIVFRTQSGWTSWSLQPGS